MNTKRILSALLCALFLVTAVVPVYADSSDYDSHIDYGLGVRATPTSYLCSSYAKSTLKLAFVNGVNHLPQSDYVTYIQMVVYYGDESRGSTALDNMFATVTFSVQAPDTAYRSIHEYFANGVSVHSADLP